MIGCIGHDGNCCTDREQEQKDAARYRWLRNYRPGLLLDMLSDNEMPNEQWAIELDSEIDRALLIPPNSGMDSD